MRPDTAEWIKKADADFLSMTREMNAVNDLNYDLVCFLAQQSVEKHLKALLCETSVPFPKTPRPKRACGVASGAFRVS